MAGTQRQAGTPVLGRNDRRLLVGVAGLLVLLALGVAVWIAEHHSSANTNAVATAANPAGTVTPLTGATAAQVPGPDATLRAVLAARPRPRDLPALAASFGLTARVPWPVKPVARAMGSSQLFEITHNVAAGGGQPAYVTTNSYTCTLVYTAAHSYWYLPQGVKIDSAAIRRLATTFEQQIRPHLMALLGTRTAIPTDPDPHMSIILGQDVVGVAYTVDQDLRPTVSEPYARGLNQIFLDSRAATDPLGAIVLANAYARLLIAHQGVTAPAWLVYGTGALAEGMAGVNGAQATTDQKLRAQRYLLAPDTALLGSNADVNLAYLWVRYLYEHAGGARLLRALASIQAPGSTALVDAALKQPGVSATDMGDTYVDWAIANLLQQTGKPAPRYGYDQPLPSVMVRRPFLAQSKVQNNALLQWSIIGITVPAGSYHLQAAASVRLTGALESGGQSFTTPNPSTPGYYWGGQADGSDSTLTRRFDFRHVKGALSLHFETAYQLGASTVYLAASSDGTHWTALPTSVSVNESSLQHLYGPAFSGSLGIWRGVTADLSAYAGKRVYLRFEQVQGYVSGWGFAVRRLTIPAITYVDTPCSGGWVSQGFSCVGDAITQLWAVRVVTGSSVKTIQLTPNGVSLVADFTVPTSSILVLSPQTPGTPSRASYTLSLLSPAKK